jgi:uncharacterized protein (TIGR02118 family)
MFKAIILLSRRADMTNAEFRTWWLEEHAPLAAQLPGVRRVVFNAVEDTGSSETDPLADGVDGISELWFDSREAFDAAYATDLGTRVAADSMAHVRGRRRLFVTEHTIVGDAPVA